MEIRSLVGQMFWSCPENVCYKQPLRLGYCCVLKKYQKKPISWKLSFWWAFSAMFFLIFAMQYGIDEYNSVYVTL